MGGKAALIVVIGFSIILGFVVRSLGFVSTRAQANMSTYAAAAESHNMAVTGANVGLARLYQDTLWRGTETQSLSASFNGSFTYTVFNGADGRPILRSYSHVRGPNEILRDTVQVVFGTNTNQSFTLFAWLTNIEGNINFISGDTIWGRIHSNDKITINGSPAFVGKVTTVKGFNYPPGTGTNFAIFKNGYETGVAPINFPTDLSKMAAAAGGGGRMYAGNVSVSLKSGTASDGDGYALVYSGATLVDSINLNDASSFNGVIGSSGVVSVSGTLDGKLSIFSTTQIYITDNILYENRASTSNDVLGLVSENNVTVADNAANQSDVYIDGSVFARSGSFGAENYNSGSPRGHLHLNGSIVQNKRGAVGTFSGSTINTGYLKAYRYDDRLADLSFRPPFYPGFMSVAYPIASWWESVHIPKFE